MNDETVSKWDSNQLLIAHICGEHRLLPSYNGNPPWLYYNDTLTHHTDPYNPHLPKGTILDDGIFIQEAMT